MSLPLGKPDAQHETQERLLAAAAVLFAERGFFGTTVREIAQRAQVNIAAGHYHFGSKQELYLEVSRRQFEQIAAQLMARHASPTPSEIDAASRPELVAMLRVRIETMLEHLVGPPPSIHGQLMQREMCDPSGALPMIVDQFIRPHKEQMQRLVARLAPGLSKHELERCCFSIVGQVFFYRMMLPIVPLLMGVGELPRDFVPTTADHITAFSLGALNELSRRPRRASGRSARRAGAGR
ncbi:MAG TPA: CerR family C-terminal domain-containing protein [Myxococcota bacterium]|nr:CerR family C-terminal domain-containing protein [Myxococcota bacterium]